MIGAIIFCLGGGLQTGAKGIDYLYAGRLNFRMQDIGVWDMFHIEKLFEELIALHLDNDL